MREYKFSQIEAKWQKYWIDHACFSAHEDLAKPKYYVLDMFPYPSGAGLHVGHPLGYVASDVYAHYKRLQGFNVLHPIGFDAFGLPAEQYALQTGTHPEDSTYQNIQTYIKQLRALGLSYDWQRTINTTDTGYYKWTQWIFLKLFDSFFDPYRKSARLLSELIEIFATQGNLNYPYPASKPVNEYPLGKAQFTANEWRDCDSYLQGQILMEYRLAYLAYVDVNWCEQLGTVLANDEVINGRSYRGGYPVTRRKMRQWNLRISAYAERLLEGLADLDYSPAIKEIQSNWIGKSQGALIKFAVKDSRDFIEVFTTRADTIFGVDFLVLAPEHFLLNSLCSELNKAKVNDYVLICKQRSELERISEVKSVSGESLGCFAIHPITGRELPVFVADYVLGHYGTGAVMGVADGDERDARFANFMQLPISKIWNEENKLQNSDFLNGLNSTEAQERILTYLERDGIGSRSLKYKIRDACWSRQRYWGEPFPVRYDKNGMPEALGVEELPLCLPKSQNFHSTKDGKGPLGTIEQWVQKGYDTDTMPTHAGAAWYFLRYTDPRNSECFASSEKLNFWGAVDVYVGGSEHAVSHLLYARFFTKVLYDLGFLSFQEPFKKLINQGKILGISQFVYRELGTGRFISHGLIANYQTDQLYVNSEWVDKGVLDLQKFKQANPDAEFILEEGKYYCGQGTEKMSKSKLNVINPDSVIDSHGADTLRLYELFLGPLEQSKPWNMHGIEGVHRFLHKLWRLVFPVNNKQILQDCPPSVKELSILHNCINKVSQDTERFAFNTAISAMMVCVNELSVMPQVSRSGFSELLKLLFPYAPHISSELWENLNPDSLPIFQQKWPEFCPEYIQKDTQNYPISINGKTRAKIELPSDITEEEVMQLIAHRDELQKWLAGKEVRKIIFVKGRIINIII